MLSLLSYISQGHLPGKNLSQKLGPPILISNKKTLIDTCIGQYDGDNYSVDVPSWVYQVKNKQWDTRPPSTHYKLLPMLLITLDGKTLLLSALHTWVIAHREVKLELTWNLHHGRLVFIVLCMLTEKDYQSYSAVNHINYNNVWPGKTCPLV